MGNLTSFDIGVSESGSQELLNDLNVNIIQALQDKLKALDPIFAALDEAWIGEDCEKYKNNVKNTILKCCDALDEVKTNFANEIEMINTSMSEFRRGHISDESIY